jgi:hypothetical protein
VSTEPDRPALEHVTDQGARGLARLTSRWRGLAPTSPAKRPVIETVLDAALASELSNGCVSALDDSQTIEYFAYNRDV